MTSYKIYKQWLALAAMLLCTGTAVMAQSATTRTGTFDASGITEYSQYLYIAPGAHVTIPAGQQWTIASQYIFIDPTAVIDGAGQMIIDDPADFGLLSENATWAGQPTTIDGGNSQVLANVVNRNPNNIVLGAVSIAASGGDITTANSDHTLYIGTSLTWATAHGDATALRYNDVVLGNNDLKFATAATEAGYSQNGYAVTNGTGHVVKESYTGNWTFPTGFSESTASGSDYTPASANNTTANGMHVLVQDYATSASVEAGANGINRTWNIYADNAAGNSTIDLQHNSSTNQANFNIASHFVTRYSSSSPNTTGDKTSGTTGPWQSNTPAAGSATGTLTTGAAIASASERSRTYTDFATTAAGTLAFYSKSSSITNPLPLKLTAFNGQSDHCTVTLSWTTVNEQDFDHFNVQYSADGSNFSTVATVKGKGNTQGGDYCYTTDQPTGTGYYRLVMTDADGSYTISAVVNVRTECAGTGITWSIYPNPGLQGSSVYLQLDAGAATSGVRLMATNVPGQKLMDMPLSVQAGRNIYALPVNGWAKGTYMLMLYDAQGAPVSNTQKIILR